MISQVGHCPLPLCISSKHLCHQLLLACVLEGADPKPLEMVPTVDLLPHKASATILLLAFRPHLFGGLQGASRPTERANVTPFSLLLALGLTMPSRPRL